MKLRLFPRWRVHTFSEPDPLAVLRAEVEKLKENFKALEYAYEAALQDEYRKKAEW